MANSLATMAEGALPTRRWNRQRKRPQYVLEIVHSLMRLHNSWLSAENQNTSKTFFFIQSYCSFQLQGKKDCDLSPTRATEPSEAHLIGQTTFVVVFLFTTPL